MDTIGKLSLADLVALQNKIVEQIAPCATLEDAAQRYMSVLYEELHEFIILARLFATIPFEGLPESNREFVLNLAHSTGISDLIKKRTMVLSLLGTRGSKPEWNDRHKSRGHIGIPLASAKFIDKIPMMSRLLKQLGAGIDWIGDNDTKLVARTYREISGVFYVQDAKTEVDNRGRKIIAAQDFVENENVKTVFGIGGGYLGSSLFFTTIIFLREFLDKDMVERFMLQANKFKTSTLNLVNDGKIFA